MQMILSAGQTPDHGGARALPPSPPKATVLPGACRHDADWFHDALIVRGISSFIPSRLGRKAPIPHDTSL